MKVISTFLWILAGFLIVPGAIGLYFAFWLFPEMIKHFLIFFACYYIYWEIFEDVIRRDENVERNLLENSRARESIPEIFLLPISSDILDYPGIVVRDRGGPVHQIDFKQIEKEITQG